MDSRQPRPRLIRGLVLLSIIIVAVIGIGYGVAQFAQGDVVTEFGFSIIVGGL